MKKLLFLFAAIAILAACDTKNPATEQGEEQAQIAFAKATYFEAIGTNTVPNVEGENKDQPFEMDSVRAEVVITSDNTLDIYLYEINFSSKMPVTIDMVIPNATFSRSADKITISGDSIVPMMGDKPYDRYMVTALNGYVTADSLVINNAYGNYSDCTYAGEIITIKE